MPFRFDNNGARFHNTQMQNTHYVLSAILTTLLIVPPSYGADEPAKAPDAAAVAEAPAGTEATLTPEQEKIWSEMKALFEASKLVNSAKAAEKAQARAKIESALDWDKVAADCLGKANVKKAGAKYGAFKNLLKEVMLKTAYSRMDKFWDGATYKLNKIDQKGGTAVLKAEFDVKSEPIYLEYFFNKKSKWLISDISYEDMRYSVNINEQLDSFLKENPFPALLDKLKKRSAELDSNTNAADTKKKG